MIFGKTYEQQEEILKQKQQWRSWFAWYPVRLNNGQLAWLQTIQRKLIVIQASFFITNHQYYEYTKGMDISKIKNYPYSSENTCIK